MYEANIGYPIFIVEGESNLIVLTRQAAMPTRCVRDALLGDGVSFTIVAKYVEALSVIDDSRDNSTFRSISVSFGTTSGSFTIFGSFGSFFGSIFGSSFGAGGETSRGMVGGGATSTSRGLFFLGRGPVLGSIFLRSR
jgi:hypothetical protein